MVAVCKDLCAFASLRLGVKFLCRPAGAEIYFGLGATNMPRRTALGSAGFSPLQCANWRGRWKISTRAVGRAVKRRESRAPGPDVRWPAAKTGRAPAPSRRCQMQFGVD